MDYLTSGQLADFIIGTKPAGQRLTLECQGFHQLAILLMYLENWRLIGCLPRVTGTIALIHTPCAKFPIVFNYIPEDSPSFSSFTQGKASSHFACGSRSLQEDAC